MKLGNKVSFGVQAVVAGQKSATVNAAPQLLVNTTEGKFTITSPVSKALGIAVGENVMFLNNIAGVENAIAQRVEGVVEFATEKGLDLDTREGQEEVLKAFTEWYIAKGEATYDAKGNPILAAQRFTEAEKKEFIAKNAQAIIDANRDALLERVGNPDATDEELIAAITVDDVESPKYHVYSGSKTSTTSKATGVGCQLGFTDTAIWKSLKADLGDEDTSVNRVFSVDLDGGQVVPYFNGQKNVDVTIYPITFVEDAAPVRRGEKA